ncbi:unnamed protein product [Arctogadus glacialis]
MVSKQEERGIIVTNISATGSFCPRLLRGSCGSNMSSGASARETKRPQRKNLFSDSKLNQAKCLFDCIYLAVSGTGIVGGRGPEPPGCPGGRVPLTHSGSSVSKTPTAAEVPGPNRSGEAVVQSRPGPHLTSPQGVDRCVVDVA